jgi:cyclic-di-AMP phosphodiesterase PgpH
VLGNDARLLFILLMVVLTVCISYLPLVIENIPMLALPFCLLPVIMRAFFDTRLALFVHLVTTLIITVSIPGDRFMFLFVQVLTGITAIFSIVNMRNRSQLFVSVMAILGTYTLLHFTLLAVTEGEIVELHPAELINYAISAVLVLLAYPLIFVFEKLFGFVSDVTLMELADTNNPLLRELAEKAPGTFQHSMQVANLAEEAIRRVGGNTLLVRAGALYHDIGKGDMPVYFIENQATGINPHDELAFEESASIIISHVLRGVEKAKAAKLPDQVIDFIRTHHGTTNTAYFLTLYKQNNPGEIVDEELFRYPGPIPYSKETAVLMMADAVEASSRSLTRYDAESIDDLVEKMIDHQADQHQFDNSDITLKDITAIKKIFKKKLRSIYHVRVEYPK